MQVKVIGYWGGYPGKAEATSSYLFEKEDFLLVVDLGSGALATFQQYRNLLEMDAVILSHYHEDHIADIGVLQYAYLVQSYLQEELSPLPIYGHKEDVEGFQSLTHDYTKGIVYDPAKALRIGPFSITFLKTNHPVPCYGMRITDGECAVVYTADSAFDSKWIDFARNADLLIADCNFYQGQDGSEAGHMTSEEVSLIAEEANVNHLLLSHLPHFGDHKQLLKEAQAHFSGSVTLAYEGYTWSK